MISWIILFVAGLLEIGWAVGLKYTVGFTRLGPSIFTIATLVGSFVLLGIAAKSLPIGVAYSVWVGIGAAGTVLFEIWLLGEPASALRLISVGLIIAGIVGLKMSMAA